ncbi:MAG: dTMP kinase [Candidatus Marinimicrobia bacterium]|nr:dTMP kinase [Candidatus Neomarinimicrobiota bacterium]
MFITFEGIDGCGKSTQAKMLENYLKKKRYNVIHIFDPGYTKIGNEVRDILLDLKSDKMNSVTEMLLYSSARSQLVSEIIKPALAENTIVISDRFYDSTTAYQGYGRNISMELIETLNKIASHNLIPNLTFIVNVDINQANNRLDKNNFDRMESENSTFKTRVLDGYKIIANENSKRCYLIEGDKSINEIHEKIKKITIEKLNEIEK